MQLLQKQVEADTEERKRALQDYIARVPKGVKVTSCQVFSTNVSQILLNEDNIPIMKKLR
jgi:ribosome maturation factor RimP